MLLRGHSGKRVARNESCRSQLGDTDPKVQAYVRAEERCFFGHGIGECYDGYHVTRKIREENQTTRSYIGICDEGERAEILPGVKSKSYM